ncbi:2-C-methyl-D-erythritol 4-phosphate cytidylyltransferase [Rugosibacter aromaticivorans]|uniref:2-C-methyl-D-erythritol 4-phosphate cytidylyltransferase n=1 Tax=Rugosibacter aromaticivorans TaxID=1565605 RepID=A0A0C5J8G6_9PROT|nr:2-C-methyl-D-erythritol 4-phosphate cytidylyltransferase [Rugosibacter aromaticivorans]AJP47944.1 2-C-methyl-D-erythritol 4-phosphate cytidylyltransferase [Rugosibacter aromaticivorans]TBR12887.1 MAG: 2-C-methyl-D-erythritol 4-phosphate cytidylyltransferase [Rugosibacter sp.]
MAYYALVPAAGTGLRMEQTTPKQYLPLAGQPLIWHALRALCSSTVIDRVFVVLAAEDAYWPDQAMANLGPRLHLLRCGGRTRAQSVLNGLRGMALMLGDIAEDWVLVHDAARPCLSGALLEKLVSNVGEDAVGGLLAVPVADTLKRAGALPGKPDDAANRSIGTVPREGLWQAQTPQMFRHGLLLQALSQIDNSRDNTPGNAPTVTDEASAVEALGLAPRLVASSMSNIKVTYPSDLQLAETILNDFQR